MEIAEIRRKLEEDKKTKENTEKEYLEIKELLKKENTKHTQPYIQKQLTDNENLRKVFLAVIDNNPALIHEVFKASLLTKPTCYAQLHKLLDLKLIKRRYYFDILKTKNKGIGDEEIIKKFDDFSSKMPENLKRYFQSRTSFWEINDFGKKFAKWAYFKQEEFKEKSEKEDG